MAQVEYIPCPCCTSKPSDTNQTATRGRGYLLVYDAAFPDAPPRRDPCCHCSCTGLVALQAIAGTIFND